MTGKTRTWLCSGQTLKNKWKVSIIFIYYTAYFWICVVLIYRPISFTVELIVCIGYITLQFNISAAIAVDRILSGGALYSSKKLSTFFSRQPQKTV